MTDEEILLILGQKMRKRRKDELKISVKEAAERSDLPISTYKRYEAGAKNMPQLDTLLKIARGLQTDLNYLIPQEHMSEDSGVWQVERKLLGLKKKKRENVVRAIIALIDALVGDD